MVFQRLRPYALLLLIPACSIPGDAAWSDLHVSGYGAIFPVGLDATAKNISVADSSGGGVTFDGDLTMEKNREVGSYYGARAGIAPFEISASAFGYNGQHASNVAGGATFAGATISEDLAATTDFDLGVTKLMLGMDVFNSPVARIGFLAGVDFVEFDRFVVTATESIGLPGLPLVSKGDAQNILINQSVAVPMIGLRGDVQLPFGVRLGGEISGLSTSVEDTDVTYLDLDLNANYEPIDNVELVVGYHRIDIDVTGTLDNATIDVKMLIDGPYFGVSLYW